MYSILVLQFGLPPQYVLDEIQVYEIKSLMDYGYYKSKEDWEQARLIAYMIGQVNTKKHLKLQDIIKFGWEKQNESTVITKEEIEQLSRQAAEMEAMYKNNDIK